jgi:hypothetical protein
MSNDALTTDQVDDAIRQLVSHTGMLHEGYTAGVREYTMLSAREGLYTLGFSADDADQVLAEIAKRGFDYCLDSHIACKSGVGIDPPRKEYPAQSVCVWGADQLHSRLQCVL